MSRICSHCGGPIVNEGGISACSTCGIVDSTDFLADENYRTNPNNASTSSALIGSDFTYQERKRYRAEGCVRDITSRLDLSDRVYSETLDLIDRVTSSSFGDGHWFQVLSAAASYVISRRHRHHLSLHEAAEAAGADDRQIGRMVLRILNFVDSGQLPDFDAANSLGHAIDHCPSFRDLGGEKKQELIAMGRFLIQCMTKWFLMTGRRPLPAVAAVAAFVAEVNGVLVSIEEIAKEMYAIVSTSKVRHRELKETLVKVSRALLPWGKDVNLNNLAFNMPLLIRIMESKAARLSKRKDDDSGLISEGLGFDLEDYLTLCPGAGADDAGEDSDYFRNPTDDWEGRVSFEESNSAVISDDKLLSAYKNVSDRIAEIREAGGFDDGDQRRKKRTRRELEGNGLWHSWVGRWDFGKKLTLEQVLAKDVGYDALPPSFVNAVESRERRKWKIKAAKVRINRTMSTADLPLVEGDNESLLKGQRRGQKPRKRHGGISEVDWEDCIIELLLLHQVDEGEIEEGQYNRLLELHVFTSASSICTERGNGVKGN